MSATEALEHSEHIAHASHGHGDHGGEGKSNLGTYVGITMAVLGVLLAFCSAKVGGERTELVQTLVAQSNAKASYHAQDVKHRVAYELLELSHAMVFGGGTNALNRADITSMAHTVDRYHEESVLAKEWTESYDPAIEAHVEAQERYENSQLAAEIGIVVASVALLTKKRLAWLASLVLGLVSVGNAAVTYQKAHTATTLAEHHIEESGRAYSTHRAAFRRTADETALTESMVEWARHPAEPTPTTASPEAVHPAPDVAHPAPAAPEAAAHAAPEAAAPSPAAAPPPGDAPAADTSTHHHHGH